MSTRGFLGWKIDGKITTTYNHSDSYPEYLGLHTIRQLQEQIRDIISSELELFPEDLQLASAVLILGARFRKIETFTENTRLSKAMRTRLADFHDGSVSTGEDNYALTRNLQGDLTAMLQTKAAMRAHADWPKESPLCEWGYLVNFDLPIPSLEIYKGFRDSRPTEGEWTGHNQMMEDTYGRTPDGSWGPVGRKRSKYFPVQRIALLPLHELPAIDATRYISTLQEASNV